MKPQEIFNGKKPQVTLITYPPFVDYESDPESTEVSGSVFTEFNWSWNRPWLSKLTCCGRCTCFPYFKPYQNTPARHFPFTWPMFVKLASLNEDCTEGKLACSVDHASVSWVWLAQASFPVLLKAPSDLSLLNQTEEAKNICTKTLQLSTA